MIEFFYSLPLWLRVLIHLYITSTLLGSALSNIYDERYKSYFAASFKLVLFVIMMTGYINEIVNIGFRIKI